MTDDKKWPPQDDSRKGPTAEDMEDHAVGNTEYVGGSVDEDAAGSGDPQPAGDSK